MRSSFVSFSGSGTAPVTGETSWGEVPQVTKGSISFALIFISLSNLQFSSENKDFHLSIAFNQLSPINNYFGNCDEQNIGKSLLFLREKNLKNKSFFSNLLFFLYDQRKLV